MAVERWSDGELGRFEWDLVSLRLEVSWLTAFPQADKARQIQSEVGRRGSVLRSK